MRKKKIVSILLAAALAVTTITPAIAGSYSIASEKNTPMQLWYDEPASLDYGGWHNWSLPLGNGGIGASVFGGVTRERIQLNEKSLWSGGPAEGRDYQGGNLPNKGNNGETIKQIQQYFIGGDSSNASSLCDQLVGLEDDNGNDGYGYYLSYGNMYLDFTYDGSSNASYKNYERTLNLDTGVAGVEYDVNGTHYTRENFVSYPDNVLVTRITADKANALNFTVAVEPDNNAGSSTNGVAENTYKRDFTTTVEDGMLTVEGTLRDNQMIFVSHTKVIADGNVVNNASTVTVQNAKTVTIITSIGTDYKNDYPEYRTGEDQAVVSERVLKYVTAATAKDYDTLKNNHLKDYLDIYGRVVLDLGQEVSKKTTDELLTAYNNKSASEAERRYLEVLLFQYGRFLTIESSRETPENDPSRATLPSNLQGIWVGANNSSWHSDYHLNVNLQMNYWPVYSTNMAECAEPLIDYVDSLRKPGRVTAKIYAGIESTEENPENGFMAHTQNNPFGWTCPGWSFNWGWSPAAVPWILQNCWEHYEYTGDLDYMKNYIYPMMKEEAILYDQMLIDETGKDYKVGDEGVVLVSSPSFSPEHGPRTAGNTYEHSLIWQLYEDAIKAAEIVGEENQELIAGWKYRQAHLKGPIEIGTDKQIKEWYHETKVNAEGEGFGHRHLSHMLGLYPGDLIQTKDEWIAAAKISMENRTDVSTGWAMGQRINTWARLRDGDKALKLIGDLFNSGIKQNLWDYHDPSYFQIDGNFGYTAGVAEMLLQSNMGYIDVLPALPDDWEDGSVEGLIARGNFEVDMTWEDSALDEMVIKSNLGGECSVKVEDAEKLSVIDSKGKIVFAGETKDGMCTFETEQGETYTVEIPKVENLQVSRDENGKPVITWNKKDGVTYTIYRRNK